jgi:putative nucleotidyltransferase with HDIG domain
VITRDEALGMLGENVGAFSLRCHCLATEAIMRALARDRGEDPDVWGLAGLLHDIDFEETGDTPGRHGLVAAEKLRGLLPDEAVRAVAAHNAECNGTERTTDFDHLLSAAESVTGLISATALIYPERTLAPVEAKSVIKRMTKTGFARAVNRDSIRECAEAGYELDDFVRLALDSMKEIAEDIGL